MLVTCGGGDIHLKNNKGLLIGRVSDGVQQSVIKVDTDDNVTIGSNNLDDMILVTDDGEAVRIKDDGKVGIGTTGPNDALEVRRAGEDVAIRIHEDAGTHEARLHLRRGGSDWEIINNNNLTIEGEGTERFRIDTSGNIGIGTNNPSEILDVAVT